MKITKKLLNNILPMKQKKLIIFIPSIESGGVEKNLFIIGNYLSNKIDKVSLITASKENRKKFIISSNCPTGPSEILDNGKTGLLFKVGDYKELAKKLFFFIHIQNCILR